MSQSTVFVEKKKNTIQLAVAGHLPMTATTYKESATFGYVSSPRSRRTLGWTASALYVRVAAVFASCPVICHCPSLVNLNCSSLHGLGLCSLLVIDPNTLDFSVLLIALGMHPSSSL